MSGRTTFNNNDIDENEDDQEQQQQQQQLIDNLNREIKELENQKKNVSDELQRFKDEQKRLQEDQERNATRLKELQDIIQREKEVLEQLDRQLTELQDQREQLEEELQRQQQILEENQQRLEKQLEELNKLKDELQKCEDEKQHLEEQREMIEREKQELDQKINELQRQIQQLEQEIKETQQRIKMIEAEIQRIEQELENIREDIQQNERDLQKIQDKLDIMKQKMLILERECDRLNEEISRIRDLMDRITSIIEMKQQNKEEFEQLKADLQQDLQEAKQQEAQIQAQVQQLNQQLQQAQQAVQALQQQAQNISNTLSQQQNDYRKLIQIAEQWKQRTSQKQQECAQLKQQEQQTNQQLQTKQQEYAKAKQDKRTMEQGKAQLENELTSIKQKLTEVETNKNNCAQKLQDAKRNLQQYENELKTAIQNERKAEEELRKQQQKVTTAEQILQKCQQKKQSCNQACQQAENELQKAQQDLQSAQEALSVAEVALAAILAFMSANPLVKVVGLVAKEFAVQPCKQKLTQNQNNLQYRQQVKEKRIHEDEEAKMNTSKAQETLKLEKTNLDTRKQELDNRKQQKTAAQEKVNQQKTVVENTNTQYTNLRREHQQVQEQSNNKTRQIEQENTQLKTHEQRMNVIKTDADNFKKKHSDFVQKGQQAKREADNNQQQYQTKLNEQNAKNVELQKTQQEQNRLKGEIQQKQNVVTQVQNQITDKQREQHRIKGQITNVQENLLMLSKSITQLQSDLREPKRNQATAERQKATSESELQSIKGKCENLERDIERNENDRRRLERDLNNHHRELIEKQKENEQLKHNLNDQRYQITLKKSELEHHEQRKLQLSTALDENKRKLRTNENKIREISNNIEQKDKLKQAAEYKVKDAEREVQNKEKEINKLDKNIDTIQKQYDAAHSKQTKAQNDLNNIQNAKNDIDLRLNRAKQNADDRKLKIRKISQEIATNKQKEININKPDLVKIMLDCVANSGWKNCLNDERIQNSIAPKKLKILEEKLKVYLNTNNQSSISNNEFNHNQLDTASGSSKLINSLSSSLSSSQPHFTTELEMMTRNVNPTAITTTEVDRRPTQSHDHQPTHETKLISMCINDYEKLQLSNLVEAGELMYINQKFDHVIDQILQEFQRENNFLTFIHNCLTPIMYLLKRHQNLDDFTESLFFKYSQIELQSTTAVKLSLRMIIHILLLNSDLSLSRMIMSLLSKRNPIPFLEPSSMNNQSEESYTFVSDIIHVWNYSTPTILSFGIGSCQGKSTLLNKLFMSSFEQSTQSIYFQTTIDIDFGYSFLPRRSTNIADTHGLMTKQLLIRISDLFDGYLIHIDYQYLLNNFDIVIDMLNIISSRKYQLIIIRDVPPSLNQQCSSLISARFSSYPSIQTFILPNIADQTNKQNKHFILTLRDKIFERIPTKCFNDPNYLKNDLQQLMTIEYKEYLKNIYTTILPLKKQLILAARENSNIVEYFPHYSKFVELCELQSKLARFNFYGNENDTIVYDVRRKIYELKETIANENDDNIIFNLFFNVLNAPNMLMCLELLATELKQERTRLVPTGDLANQLPIQKSLSLEVLWRNAIVCSQRQSDDIQKLLYGKYYQYISGGFPFEIIDGDNFCFQYQFLLQTLAPFRDKKTLVISVIGPQNSGKSTLLNYMFGTLFDVRDGRCTRGIYGSFVKSNQSDFDYIMLIDTEGLLGIEREDPEYDRRIVLFCLAVSHIVIVNMVGEVSSTLQTMLTLCTESLEKMGVTRIPQPVVHFILNQKADLNIENNQAAIDRIISDLKKFGLGQSIDIRKETFHTLPSAFKKEGQTLTTSNTKLPNAIKTEPDFIERVQLLCGEIIHSAQPCLARSFEFFDPLQWLTSSNTIFDTLQKFSDLTYYRDINERHLDNEIREHIRNDLIQIFSSDYRDQLIIDSLHKTEDEIRELFIIKQTKIQEIANQNVENLFKLLKAPDTIRIRSREFLRTQIIEMFNALRTSTIANNEREKVKLLVRNGAGDLQRLIDDTINSGVQMSSDVASEQFNRMFNNSIESIKKKFVADERLKQAFKHIYTNYNIYEKESLPDFQHISYHFSMLSKLNESRASINDLKDEFISRFTSLAYKYSSVTAHHFNPNTTTLYSIEIIRNLNYLNKKLLEQAFINFCNTPSTPTQTHSSQRRDGNRHRNSSIITTVKNFVLSLSRDDNNNTNRLIPKQTIMSTEQFQMDIRNIIQEEKPLILTATHIDERNMFLRLSEIILEILKRIMTIMKGTQQNEVRQIRTELIQKIVGLVNTLIIDINNELAPFCLTLSRQLKSIFHTYAIVLLTKYYYDEQINHFLQTLADIENKKADLKNYFISMVVPNASVDTNYAINLAKQVKDHLIEKLTTDGQRTIDQELKQYSNMNRKWIQDRCDGQLLTNTSSQWYIDYIENPTKIIEQFFNELWINIQNSINQKLMDRKSYHKNILTEFFRCLKGVYETVRKLGSAARFVDDIFEPEENNSLDAHQNLINKKRCMTILLHKYLSGQSIPSLYVINTKTYKLKKDPLDAFQSLTQQYQLSDILITITKEMSSIYDNISIGNLVVFLQSLLNEEKQIVNEYNQIQCDFNRMDTQDTYARLLDKIRGCPDLCPCCKRPCDVDHTQIISRPGSQYNEHRCISGHALCAMNGYKFEVTNEASLLMCEQIPDDQIIVVGSTRYQWSQFKLNHSDWNFESALNEDELNRLHGKFLIVWERIGKQLPQKCNMKYVTYKQHLISEETDVQLTPVFHSNVDDLSLQSSKYCVASSQQGTANNIPTFLKPISNNTSSIVITCLNIDSSLIQLNSKYSIESFNDECACIARLLSIVDKHIYFIVLRHVGEYVIPLVHEHQCIERIYIYCSDNKQREDGWMNRFPKIRDCSTNYNVLLRAVDHDIQSIYSNLSSCSNENLILKCHTQTLINSPEESFVSLNKLNVKNYSSFEGQIHIVILYCDNSVSLHREDLQFEICECSDIVKCKEHLKELNVQSVFLIVCGQVKNIIRDLKTVSMLEQIYTIYCYVPVIDIQELDETILGYKNIDRLFDNIEVLKNRLNIDIDFRLKQTLCIPVISIYNLQKETKVDDKLSYANERQDFAAFQIFVKVIQESPPPVDFRSNIYGNRDIFAENDSDSQRAKEILMNRTDEIFNWFINVPFLSFIMNSMLQKNTFENLLYLQNILMHIDRHFVDLSPTTSSSTVYRVQFLREQDLEIIKKNINKLFAFHTYIVATKNLLTAQAIARQAVNRGLLVAIFQIEIPPKIHVLELNNDRLMFRFGASFRIRSISLAADAIYYVQLKFADSDFQKLQQQLQIQVCERLTWLTLGNYLCALNLPDEATTYYQHLIESLGSEHPAISSIYNNMGLIYTKLNDDDHAMQCYETAENSIHKNSSNKNTIQQNISSKTLPYSSETVLTVDYCTLYEKMAEIHLCQSKHEEALKYYRKALELTTDPLTRIQFEQKIKKNSVS